MVNKLSILTAAFVLLFSLSAEAKTLYVDQSRGNDSVTYEVNNTDNPWRTIGRAAWGSTNRSVPSANQAAKAGDTVIVRAGTYSTEGTGLRYYPAYTPVNSGANGSPIVFQAEGTVVLTQSGNGAVIGAYQKDYITWKGFTIYEINALGTPDTGPAVIWYSTGGRIEDCTIDGYDNGLMGNNHNGIRLEYAINAVIRNNKIYNVLNFGGYHQNGAAIMSYFSSGAIIENNEIFNCGSGIFVKGGDNANFTIRYNLVYGCQQGIVFMYNSATGEHKVYQNVSRNNSVSGITLSLYSKNVKVVNNTFVDNPGGGVYLGPYGETHVNNRIQNNIIYNAREAISGGECNNAAVYWLDYNTYYNNTDGWSIALVRYPTITSWRTALGGCPGTGKDCNSITSNPLFVSYSGSNFRLQAGSPSINAGIDILDLNRNGSTTDRISIGAYITGEEIIGRTLGSPAPSPPPDGNISPPSNLRIQ